MNERIAFTLGLVLFALSAALPAEAGDGFKRYRSNAEVLRDLHRSQASGSAWSGLAPGSYSRYRKHGESPVVGTYDETHKEILTGTTRGAAELTIELGSDGSRHPWLPQSFTAKELEPQHAQRFPDERIVIDGRTYDAEVYQFEDIREQRSRYVRRIVHTYWINALVPGGVLRHLEVTEERVLEPVESNGQPASVDRIVSREESDTRLDGIDIEFTVDGKRLKCICRSNETGRRDQGKFSKSRICWSDKVPGGRVKAETSHSVDGRETGHATEQLLEFETARPVFE